MTTRQAVRAASLVLGTLLAVSVPFPAGAASRLPEVHPRAETAPLFDDKAGGKANADDPAIWRNDADPGRSLVIATAKQGGLRVYDLEARQVQALAAPAGPGEEDAPGRFNNVDLLKGVRIGGAKADLAVVTDRGNDRLRVYRIDPDRPGGPLTDVTDPGVSPVFSADQAQINEQATAYGLATWTDRRTGRSYAIASQRHRTRLALLELTATPADTVTYRQVRTVDLPASFRLPDGGTWAPCAEPGELPQVEGMVVDPESGTLYAGQEDVGIWRIPADLSGRPELMDRVREYGVPATYDPETEECVPGADPGYGGKHLTADVEGLTILDRGHGGGYLLASSQGDDTFVAYDREREEHNEFEGAFRITAASATLDGSEVCDGAAVLNAPLGRRYPHGLMVVQDGQETPGDGDREATGFKYVDLRDVLRAID
ncbi:phytase [Kitasatospora sp. NPDC001664]